MQRIRDEKKAKLSSSVSQYVSYKLSSFLCIGTNLIVPLVVPTIYLTTNPQ